MPPTTVLHPGVCVSLVVTPKPFVVTLWWKVTFEYFIASKNVEILNSLKLLKFHVLVIGRQNTGLKHVNLRNNCFGYAL